LLIAASVFWGLGQVLEQGLRAASYPRPGIVSNLLGLAVLLALGIPACAHFGINGMAASFAIAELTNLATLITFCILILKMPLGLLWAFEPRTLREFVISVRLMVDRVPS
jgi:O-antigen/teichoic acid export membrane protein